MATVDDETALVVGRGGCLVQNLGPGLLYIGEESVSESNGLQLGVGESVSLNISNTDFYVISDDTYDVRILSRGSGIYNAAVAG